MLDWRSRRTWHLLGSIATVIWLTHVALTTDFDPGHPLFDYIFIVPLAGWVMILFLTRRLERPPDDEN
ncbi:MAG: hypothetical protein QF578_24740 [Alphaproteobacteria bacterium]|jgi:hypothetical protein|nr:hypothetical protein [Alphaproteobacteria bacterium]MDP6568053.1 hypothetical protein [Alphaproteobacteria bacterium]MDP6813377.1 hypothetical protein [Alphaproteobacteria bacterium]